VDVAKMVGVSRLVRGINICSPVSDFKLDETGEKEMQRKFMNKAIKMLQQPGQKEHYEVI